MSIRTIEFRTPILNDYLDFQRFFYWGFRINDMEAFTPPLKHGIEKTGYQQQFTGLKDKNNTKIYDGDLVVSNNDERIYEIKYSEKDACFVTSFNQGIVVYNINPNILEVIGHIYLSEEKIKEKAKQVMINN